MTLRRPCLARNRCSGQASSGWRRSPFSSAGRSGNIAFNRRHAHRPLSPQRLETVASWPSGRCISIRIDVIVRVAIAIAAVRIVAVSPIIDVGMSHKRTAEMVSSASTTYARAPVASAFHRPISDLARTVNLSSISTGFRAVHAVLSTLMTMMGRCGSYIVVAGTRRVSLAHWTRRSFCHPRVHDWSQERRRARRLYDWPSPAIVLRIESRSAGTTVPAAKSWGGGQVVGISARERALWI